MRHLAVLLLVATTGCAICRIQPDGTLNAGVFGAAKAEYTLDKDGLKTAQCDGGTVSPNATTILTALISGAVSYFTYGALK